jgi:hypothetical protein
MTTAALAASIWFIQLGSMMGNSDDATSIQKKSLFRAGICEKAISMRAEG